MRYAILTLALFFCGCPNPSQPGQQARLDLKIDQPDQAPSAGATRQLTLQFGGQGQAMLGAMIDKQNPPTTWHADPADAVTFDPQTAQVQFTKPGTVKIWATYTQDGKQLQSNALTLKVTPKK